MSLRPNCQNAIDCKAKGAGHCKSCAAIMRGLDPAYREMMSAAKKRSFAEDPEKLARVVRAVTTAFKRWHATVNWTSFHGNRSEQYMAWCPAERRGEYRTLRKRFGSIEARRIILEDTAHQGRMEVARNRAAMLEKHQRDLASRY